MEGSKDQRRCGKNFPAPQSLPAVYIQCGLWLTKMPGVQEVHCDMSRFIKREGFAGYFDTSTELRVFSITYDAREKCFDPKQVATSGTTQAVTTSSDLVNIAAWKAAGGPAKNIPKDPYVRHRSRFPNTIDICAWYRMKVAAEGWPKVDAERIEKGKSQELIDALTGNQTPIDTIVHTMGSLFLHEVCESPQRAM